mmetsp:Transcript_17205/g.39758  ORF Transcript_17205/g.39758 Transcript_17205/m.39758 type:complete len:208 (+) Transcript_17205:239-862(+)
MNPTRSKHRYLEFRVDGRSAPWLWADGRHQVNIGLNVTFSFPRKTLYTPYDCLLLWFIFGTTKRMFDFCLRRIFRNWYLDDDVCSKQLIREVCNHLQIYGNFCQTLFFLNSWNDSEWQINVVRHTIFHEFELSIWGDECDCTICIEFSKADTAMESTIIDVDTWLSLAFLLNDELVVETKFTFGHPRELRIHLNSTGNFITQNTSGT